MTQHALGWKGLVCLVSVVATTGAPARAGELPPLVHETVLNVPAAQVWAVLATSEGYKKWGVAHAEIDLRVGGLIRTHYDPKGTLGDPGTIEQTILAFDPGRMIAFKIAKAPAGFPFPNAMTQTWSIATIDDLGDGRSRLTLKGLGYTDDEESRKMREFFDAGNAWSLEKLRSQLEGTPAPTRAAHDAAGAEKDGSSAGAPTLLPPATSPGAAPSEGAPIEVEAIVPAPLADVWRSWTTREGLRSFMSEGVNMELRPGGPFEILFKMEAPEGQRGSEGCVVLSYEPMRMLSFSWNAPPQFAHARSERTWVVLTFESVGADSTRVRLSHHGWTEKLASEPEHAGEWRQVRDYFTHAWPRVLQWLQEEHAGKRPG